MQSKHVNTNRQEPSPNITFLPEVSERVVAMCHGKGWQKNPGSKSSFQTHNGDAHTLCIVNLYIELIMLKIIVFVSG